MILASGMACRLSEKFGHPVFVSITVAKDNENDDLVLGESNSLLTATSNEVIGENSRMTVARIEREVTKILLNHR